MGEGGGVASSAASFRILCILLASMDMMYISILWHNLHDPHILIYWVMSYESPTPSLVGVLCSFALRNQRKPQTSITYSTLEYKRRQTCARRGAVKKIAEEKSSL